MKKEVAIKVRKMTKYFNIYSDKANTLKEKLLFWKRGNKEIRTVLKDINIDIKKGETVALIGTNGSGKSTLLKLMTKIIYPSKGTVETNGKLTSLLELGAGFHPDFSGRENIYLKGQLLGLKRKEIQEVEEKIIEFSQIGEYIDQPVRTYSSGMKARLGFSINVNIKPEILIVDEALSVGDEEFKNKCIKKINSIMKNDNVTLLFVTHATGVAKEFCSRGILMENGKLVFDGNIEETIKKYESTIKKK